MMGGLAGPESSAATIDRPTVNANPLDTMEGEPPVDVAQTLVSGGHDGPIDPDVDAAAPTRPHKLDRPH